MRGVRRKIEYMETSFLPSLKTALYLTAFVDCGVIQNDHCLFADANREILHKFDKSVGVYVLLGDKTMIYAVAVYHSEDIEPSAFVNGDAVILVLEFPCIRHVFLGAYMAFITVIKVNESGFPLTFKLLQKFLLITVLLRRGCPFGRLSYTSKSCAKADKKALYVSRHASLPVACCHLSLAFMTLSLSFSMASLTASSSDESIMGLAPWPGLFQRPSTPCARYRLTQRLTLGSEHDSLSAISFEGVPGL